MLGVLEANKCMLKQNYEEKKKRFGSTLVSIFFPREKLKFYLKLNVFHGHFNYQKI